MGLVTITLRDAEALVCDSLNNFTFKLNDEKQELEVYKNDKFLGYFANIIGITEDEFINYIKNILG